MFLAFPLFAVFVWVLAAAMAQRLRDAGKLPALALAFLLGLIAWLYLSIELIEVVAVRRHGSDSSRSLPWSATSTRCRSEKPTPQ